MQINSYIEKIVNNGKPEDMEELSEILEDLMYIVKDYDEDCYEKYKMKLYGMAYNYKFTKEMAEEIVHKMRPYGMKWSYEEVKDLQEQYGIDDIRVADFFVVINSAYNDYKNLFGEDIDQYIKFTIDFIKDEDAKEGKVFLYFM